MCSGSGKPRISHVKIRQLFMLNKVSLIYALNAFTYTVVVISKLQMENNIFSPPKHKLFFNAD